MMFLKVMLLSLVLGSRLIKGEKSCTFPTCNHMVNKSAPLRFLSDADPELFSPPGAWFAIDCCADGFTNIDWQYHSADNSTWIHWPWFKPCPRCIGPPYRELCDHDQMIQFVSMSLADTGTYRCNVSNSLTGQHIIREQELVVAFCDNIQGHIQPYQKPDSLHQPATIGSTLNLTCAGYFGCPSRDPMRHANWSYVDANGETTAIVPEEDNHFNVEYNQSFPYITVGSILTIEGLREEDYNLQFQCHLATSLSHMAWTLTLHTPEKTEKLNVQVIIITVCSTLSFALLMTVVVSVYCCYRPQVDYAVGRRRGTLIARGPDQEDYHDACVIHSTENEDFVENEIKTPLEEENYDIRTKVDADPAKTETQQNDEIVGKSMCAILILSQAEIRESQRVQFLFSMAVDCKEIIVVDCVDGWQRAVKAKTLGTLPKVLKTLKWRGKHNMSPRQLKNFLFEIKLKLPEPRVSRTTSFSHHSRVQSDSSTVPLITRATSLPSETGIQFESQDSPTFCLSANEETVTGPGPINPPHLCVTEGNDEVFHEDMPRDKHKPGPQKQLSQDSGYAKSQPD